jgi:hypothetical protein
LLANTNVNSCRFHLAMPVYIGRKWGHNFYSEIELRWILALIQFILRDITNWYKNHIYCFLNGHMAMLILMLQTFDCINGNIYWNVTYEVKVSKEMQHSTMSRNTNAPNRAYMTPSKTISSRYPYRVSITPPYVHNMFLKILMK